MSLVVEMKPQLWQTPVGNVGLSRQDTTQQRPMGSGSPSPGCAGKDRGVPMGTLGSAHSPFRVSVCTFR